ncbi:hypothetical protein SPBR_01879 [Sporothrix brasiliensis 5110]|uniref:Copper acquisition factor BIM1-like domain-containing protein n=1 Tax=Sporothrix brasiliensis 5110 TaxID=1398154 RepID=A0A0C2FIZ3_9PEZI|nr:uncharacterized protein SPBR_01879 [Sporothrix brasiliensis 5110]KIH91113.1 hypothetical protein SPBR_01879 [Sporothrix brasiliensis 5110]
MRFATILSATATMAGMVRAAHGDGDEGSIMGPVAFLWPDDRNWSAAADNNGPCGSTEGVTNRTLFPLSHGSVALSIADEAYKVAFYVAFTNDPTRQTEFQEQVVNNVTEVAPGHQCYKIDPVPPSTKAGTNATIQLQYWAVYEGENNNQNETFYACADITFVEDADIVGPVPCFNVTASDFSSEGSSSTTAAGSDATTGANGPGSGSSAVPTTASSAASSTSSDANPASETSGLAAGAKAGIAVGSIAGVAALAALGVFVYTRKRRTGYLERRRASKINAPIPLNKRNPDGTSVTSA